MGLDVSHDCWHGAYSAFGRWRCALWEDAGYELTDTDMGGFSVPWPAVDWNAFTDDNLNGDWDNPPEDPLYLLIVHSDCDGHITAKNAPWLAARLEQLLPVVAQRPDDAGHIGNWADKTQRFIDGLREAAASDEDVEFY